MKINKIYYLLFFITFSILTGCQWFQNNEDPLVAQVDKYKLKLSDINESLGFDYDPQLKDDYINIWVKKHLWLKESQRYIHHNRKINKLVKDYENSLIIQEYQQKYIFDKISITEGDVREYYKQHKQDFKSYDEAAYIQMYKIQSKEEATKLYDNIKNSIHPNIPSEFKLIYKNDCIEEIDNLLFTSKANKHIGPIKVDNYYYVIVVIEKYSKDSILAMEHVRNDIIQMLRATAYVTAIDKKQNELKDQYNVKIIKNTGN